MELGQGEDQQLQARQSPPLRVIYIVKTVRTMKRRWCYKTKQRDFRIFS
jgi:hypothetical protein